MKTRSRRRSIRPVLVILIAAAALVTATQALAAPSSAINGRCQRNFSSFGSSSSTAPVGHNYPLPPWLFIPAVSTGEAADMSAFADAASQTLRALAFLGIDGNHGDNDCSVTASMTDTATVHPGGGHNLGDVVHLVLTPGLQGRFEAGPSPLAPTSLTSITTSASVTLADETACSFGCVLAEFTASLDESTDASGPDAFHPNGALINDTTWRWRLSSNAADDNRDSATNEAEICSVWPCTIAVTDPAFNPFVAAIDTGTNSIDFAVRVGTPFSIDARLSVLLQAYGGLGLASADLSHTFHFSLAPAAGYEGVTVSYESAGSTADTSAPIIDCEAPDGLWHADNVSLACTAHDDGAGLAHTDDASFSLSTSVPAGSETAEAATGTRQVCDNAGNCATAGPIGGNRVDRGAPTLHLPANVAVDATGPAGAAVGYSATATDGTDPTPSVTCTPAAGSPFAIGATVVTCTATDHAGNTAGGTFSVTVKGAKEQLNDLVQIVMSATALPTPAKTQLIGSLQALVARFDPANATQKRLVCGALKLFAAAVQTISGRLATPSVASGWIADADRIRSVLACG